MEAAMRAIDTIKSIRVRPSEGRFSNWIRRETNNSSTQETRLSALRPPSEFFDPNRISRPADINQAVSVRRFFRAVLPQKSSSYIYLTAHIV